MNRVNSSLTIGFGAAGLSLVITGCILNISGAMGLRKCGLKRHNQNHLLLNLSIVAGFGCLSFVGMWITWMRKRQDIVESIFFILTTGFYMAFILSTFGLTFDRFVAVARPFWYRRVVTERGILIFVRLVWIFSLISRIPFFFVSNSQLIIVIYLDVSVDAVCILVQPATYLYLYIRWRDHLKQFETTNSNTMDSRRMSLHVYSNKRERNNSGEKVVTQERESRLLKVSFFIVFSCLVASVCDILYLIGGMSVPSSNSSIMAPLGLLLWSAVVSLQPLIYMTIKPEIRRYFRTVFCCSRKTGAWGSQSNERTRIEMVRAKWHRRITI